MNQTSLEGGVWKNKFHDHYRLFEIEELYLGEEAQHKFRAIGNIPNGDGTSEYKVFVSENRSHLISLIKEFYGGSRRDEAIREWQKGMPKVAHNFIVNHPEITGAILKWTWNHRAKICDQGFKIETHVDDIDAEYSFAGLRGDLVDFLNKYDCWDWAFNDEARYTIDEYGILHITYGAENPDYYDMDFYDDDLSFPDIGDIIDNEDDDLYDMVEAILYERAQKEKKGDSWIRYKLREAGF